MRSKKPSGVSYPKWPPEHPVFIIDASLGRHKFAGLLKAKGLNVVVHDDVFEQGTPDTVCTR